MSRVDADIARISGRSSAVLSALIPSEQRVAALAAEWFSNKEIAGRLFVTTSTVEVHL